MKNKAIKAYLRFELIMFFRNFITAFFLLIFPAMMLIIFGSIYGNKPNALYGGFGAIDMFIPAYSGIVISVTGLMNIPLTLCEYREKGIFKRYRATPSDPSSVILAQLIINSVMTTIGMAFLIILGKLVYQVKLPANIVQCLLLFLVSIFCIFAIGFFIGGLAPGMKAANSIAYLIFFPMLFLSGATIPYEILPPAARQVSKLFPLTYTVSAMKSVWNGGKISENINALLLLLVFGAVFWTLSRYTFKWET